MSYLLRIGAICVLLAATAQSLPAIASPVSGFTASTGSEQSAVVRTQVEIYVGRPYRPHYAPYPGYRSYYYDNGPYYRPRPYYYAPPPPDVTYYETRPYVVRPAPSGGDPDAIARCASRFKSFNANTGTYVTYDGEERVCPYLR